MRGALIAFEGIDQAGKMTQARMLAERAEQQHLRCTLLHYPDYATPIGRILEQALCAGLPLDAHARTMLFAANRWEKDALVRQRIDAGELVLIDRYSASNIVYGLAQGFGRDWLEGLESGLLPADVTVFVDIAAEESARRKQNGRDDFERNATLLREARKRYRDLAAEQGWTIVDGRRDTGIVHEQIRAELRQHAARLPVLSQV